MSDLQVYLKDIKDPRAQYLLRLNNYYYDEELSKGHRLVFQNLKTLDPVVVIDSNKLSVWDTITKSKRTLKKEDDLIVARVGKKYNSSSSIILKYLYNGIEKTNSQINLFLGTDKIPRSLNAVLHKYGNEMIVSITCCRKPFDQSTVDKIDSLTFGDFSYKQKKYNFKANHTSLLLKFINGTTIRLEKLADEPVVMTVNPQIPSTTSFLLCDKIPILTLNELIVNTQKYMKQNFNAYDVFTNNCQHFCLAVLKSNNIQDPHMNYYKFLKQEDENLFNEIQHIEFALLSEAQTINAVINGK
jgi:hypothetical protein